LAIAKDAGFEVYALTFRYGQRHKHEVRAAQDVASRFGVPKHVFVDIDLRLVGGSALTAEIDLPKGRSLDEIGRGIPVTGLDYCVLSRASVSAAARLVRSCISSPTPCQIGVLNSRAIEWSGSRISHCVSAGQLLRAGIGVVLRQTTSKKTRTVQTTPVTLCREMAAMSDLEKKDTLDGRNRSNLAPGREVLIVLKQDQKTGKLTRGVVKDILTNSAFHPRGVKVRLTDGKVGRVQQVIA
jgi:uncharacterized repeat protein (TIGR03833 family)